MGYKIAIASTDGVRADAHFGSTKSFTIIEVKDDGSYVSQEERIVPSELENETIHTENSGCVSGGAENNSCGSKKDCGNNGGGCGGHSDSKIESRILLISDCRCIICKNIGPGAERQLQRQAITAFQIDNYIIEDALVKIIGYYNKIDNHISLRSSSNK